MRPLQDFPKDQARRIRAVFTDIDDTLTNSGQLLEMAYRALWRLHDAGIAVVPVTGRPAGWCDHMARMWPVAGIIGENGAFYFRYMREARKLMQQFVLPASERAHCQQRLQAVAARILQEVPGCALASDQFYRMHDLAIDYAEDVAPLSAEQVAQIVFLFIEAGATAKVSSIHVNGWFGNYDKLGMIQRFAREALDLDLKSHESIYVGDSPNDEPCFAHFAQSVGVANVDHFRSELRTLPTFVTRTCGGQGFAELVDYILSA